jgi:hypothetical protein
MKKGIEVCLLRGMKRIVKYNSVIFWPLESRAIA